MTPLGRAALIYASRYGFAVFPLAPRSKIPLIAGGHGCLDATLDSHQIERWWRAEPEANVGIALGVVSDAFALDVDPRSGGDLTLDDLLAEHEPLPPTIEALTGGGGRHLFFRMEPTLTDATWSPLGPGVDVKGSGGYVVAPPSIHPSGRVYAWEASAHPNNIAIATSPAWLTTQLLRGRKRNGVGPATDPDAAEFYLGQLFARAGWLGQKIKPGVWAVRCPSEVLHSCGHAYDSSTVLFAPPLGRQVGKLFCAHGHCRELYDSCGYEVVARALAQATGIALDRERTIGEEG